MRAVLFRVKLVVFLAMFALAAVLVAGGNGNGNATPALAPALFLSRLRLNCKVPVLY